MPVTTRLFVSHSSQDSAWRCEWVAALKVTLSQKRCR